MEWLNEKGNNYADFIGFFDSFYEEVEKQELKKWGGWWMMKCWNLFTVPSVAGYSCREQEQENNAEDQNA